MATKKASPKDALNAGTAGGTALADMRAQMRAEVQALASRLGAPGGDVIKCTQDKYFEFPDGTKSAGPFSAVIVDFVSANNYYEGAYDPKNIVPPVCFAIGLNPTELVPSDNSPIKQADACAVCPQNVFGSDGKNGKACKNTRVLAVLPPDATKDTPLWIIKVSPTAIKSFDAYVKSVAASFETAPVGVVTEIGFDPSQTYGSLRFGNPRPNENLAVAFARRSEAMTRLMTEPDVSSYEAQPKPKKVTMPARRR